MADNTQKTLSALRDVLVAGYDDQARAVALAESAGIAAGTLPSDKLPMREWWWETIRALQRQGRLLALVDAAIADPAVAGLKPRFEALREPVSAIQWPAPEDAADAAEDGRAASQARQPLAAAIIVFALVLFAVFALSVWQPWNPPRRQPAAGSGPATGVFPTATPWQLGEVARQGNTLTIPDPIGMELIRVEAGPFLMGSDRDRDDDSQSGEEPQTSVTVGEFYIGKYEVTNRQYELFVQDTNRWAPAHFVDRRAPAGLEDHPVINVNWNDAKDFTNWLNEKTADKYAFRLPTEAEWEKACRGADGRLYPWGDTPDPQKAHFNLLGGPTMPVGSFSPQGDSPYGLADMAGNVWEWTGTRYQDYPYDSGDGREKPIGAEHRVLRGGSMDENGDFVRCAVRSGRSPELMNNETGFRVAASP